MKNKNCQFYLLGPNIDKVSEDFLAKYNAIFYQTKSNYKLFNFPIMSLDSHDYNFCDFNCKDCCI